ncbi:baseplate J/gp47 family protein [Priestia megaterium]|uniref:baseplate J/gp47 family protein n=1 Tax=Priestia megaterium TaxID=1404 RepID=UPI001D6094B5|nr:baseplate J/gp47 family protein [Priestia megaterium]CAH0305273.1 hypothetical protein SRABI82_04704 [Priestia megaterium]
MTIFDGETYEAILERMLARLPSDVDKREGSVVYDMLAPAAIELAQAYIEMDNVLDLGFVDNTYGEYLDRRAAEQGLTRKEATKATGEVTFEGLDGVEVPMGTRVSTADDEPIYFVTTDSVTLFDGTATAKAEAEVGGANSSVQTGEITEFDVSDIPGVATVTNNDVFTGGFDEESDEDFIARYKEYVGRPITSGNKYQYEAWAKEISGVSNAMCYPLWQGPGTVKVVLINEDKRSPSQEIIETVTAHIEEERPVGADVTVVGVTEIPVDITATLTLTDGSSIDAVSAAIAENLKTYFQTIAFDQTTVRYTQIGNAILDADGVIDYADLKANGTVANIILAADEVPVAGSVVVTVN